MGRDNRTHDDESESAETEQQSGISPRLLACLSLGSPKFVDRHFLASSHERASAAYSLTVRICQLPVNTVFTTNYLLSQSDSVKKHCSFNRLGQQFLFSHDPIEFESGVRREIPNTCAV